MTASRALKAFWPPQFKKILSACRFIRKPSLNISQSGCIVLEHGQPLYLGQVESSKYPYRGLTFFVAVMRILASFAALTVDSKSQTGVMNRCEYESLSFV